MNVQTNQLIAIPPSQWLACVDIGGTKVAACLARAQGLGEVMVEATVQTGKPTALAQQVLELIGKLCAAQGLQLQDIADVGICTCGPLLHSADDMAIAAPNLCGGLRSADDGKVQAAGLANDWRSIPLLRPLQSALPHARIHMAIDTIAALEAERIWGALQGQSHCAYVTWSTGIGAALCVDGQVLRGKNGNAGHLGHSFVAAQNAQQAQALCGCGNQGDVEAICGGRNWQARLSAQGSFSDLPALFAAARDVAHPQHAQALREVEETASVLGQAIYNMTVLGDLQTIAIGGSVFYHHQALLQPLLQRVLDEHGGALTHQVQIVPAGLGEQVGQYGALALCLPAHSRRGC